ncbi:hypothetical protein HETIRDRAFT_328274 [Heterobasidion irregulare TC 32-1]|uniref:DUF6534 domain-containing protein n=1 Tax=Heterobasidion irregulare (strain TC 32-1) TaxID=747525 RepID=W4JTL6_HETIT|nr:uncharacterized protein HETIRDRAFT_328274 [Heterobasidion irregulare TC 32-1]ETW76878.1 hypothetical protein HETIRDRAFT_328274 [Heterobasidion irregulare TC 32-1]
MASPTDTDIRGSLGVVILGGMGATALSGAVAALVFLYFRMYSTDALKTKALVFWLWVIDAAHTCLINTSNWESLMVHFGDRDMGDFIPTLTALTILFTDVNLCLSHHSLYAYAMRKISRKWYISAPLMFMATLRLAQSPLRLCMNSILMLFSIELRSWEHFMTRFWSITTAYCLSAAIDIYLSMTLCYFLRVHRKCIGMNSTNKLLDRIMINTVNNGTATWQASQIISTPMQHARLTGWFVFRGTLIFLGTHLLIGKLYTISVVSTLLLRRTLREEYNRSSAVANLCMDSALHEHLNSCAILSSSPVRDNILLLSDSQRVPSFPDTVHSPNITRSFVVPWDRSSGAGIQSIQIVLARSGRYRSEC